MYFTISPFLYYISHKENIENLLTIELNGELFYLSDKNVVKSLVEIYVNKNSEGIEEKDIDKYVEYICNQLTG